MSCANLDSLTGQSSGFHSEVHRLNQFQRLVGPTIARKQGSTRETSSQDQSVFVTVRNYRHGIHHKPVEAIWRVNVTGSNPTHVAIASTDIEDVLRHCISVTFVT